MEAAGRKEEGLGHGRTSSAPDVAPPPRLAVPRLPCASVQSLPKPAVLPLCARLPGLWDWWTWQPQDVVFLSPSEGLRGTAEPTQSTKRPVQMTAPTPPASTEPTPHPGQPGRVSRGSGMCRPPKQFQGHAWQLCTKKTFLSSCRF